jgi:hypothetical protein
MNKSVSVGFFLWNRRGFALLIILIKIRYMYTTTKKEKVN